MEIIGKLIHIRKYFYITIPSFVYQHWCDASNSDVKYVLVSYDEKDDSMIIYPYLWGKEKKHVKGEIRKLIIRGSTVLITIPFSIGTEWFDKGVIYLRKMYFEDEYKLVVKPL